MYQEIRTSELFGSGLIGRRIKGFDRKKSSLHLLTGNVS